MDFRIDFSILRVDVPENLNDAQNITVKLQHARYPNITLLNGFKLVGNNTLEISVNGENQMKIGAYRLTVSYTKHNPVREPNAEPFIVDIIAVELVESSSDIDDIGGDANLFATQIELIGVIHKHL